jgi:hypothetical protein
MVSVGSGRKRPGMVPILPLPFPQKSFPGGREEQTSGRKKRPLSNWPYLRP